MASYRNGPGLHYLVKCLFTITALLLSSTGFATCQQQPTPDCLLHAAISLWQQLDPNDPGRATIAAQLTYETDRYGIPFPQDLQQTTESQARRQLRAEDNFIQALQKSDFTQARTLLSALKGPLQDSFAATPQALFIEYLTLALRDHQADTFKKQYYETLVKLDDNKRTLRMMEVARHEILGGQPDKGQRTLDNTGVDEFSDSVMLNDKIATEILASQSQQLFLHPEDQLQGCTAPAGVADAAVDYLKPSFLSLQRRIDNIPDERTRLRTRLELAHLFHNSQQCALPQRWLVAQTIQEAAPAKPEANDAAILSLVYLARAIRRYIF